VAKHEPGTRAEGRVDQCPYCGTRNVTVQTQSESATIRRRDGGTYTEHWHVLMCNQCSGLILHRSRVGACEAFDDLFPAPHQEIEEHPGIPDETRADYWEATQGLAAGCFKSSMVMGRRALQRVLKANGHKQRHLADQIDAAIDADTIGRRMRPLATEIREYGNLGAHPDDDELKCCTKENAEKLLGFVQMIVHELYRVPAEAERLRTTRGAS
jgi:hypothetical protein